MYYGAAVHLPQPRLLPSAPVSTFASTSAFTFAAANLPAFAEGWKTPSVSDWAVTGTI